MGRRLAPILALILASCGPPAPPRQALRARLLDRLRRRGQCEPRADPRAALHLRGEQRRLDLQLRQLARPPAGHRRRDRRQRLVDQRRRRPDRHGLHPGRQGDLFLRLARLHRRLLRRDPGRGRGDEAPDDRRLLPLRRRLPPRRDDPGGPQLSARPLRQARHDRGPVFRPALGIEDQVSVRTRTPRATPASSRRTSASRPPPATSPTGSPRPSPARARRTRTSIGRRRSSRSSSPSRGSPRGRCRPPAT